MLRAYSSTPSFAVMGPVAWYMLPILFITLLFVYYRRKRERCKLPPGPPGSFFFGNSLQIGQGQNIFNEWGRKYGDVYTIYLSRNPVIIVTGEATIREVLIQKGQEFGGRIQSFRHDYLFEGTDLVMGDYSPKWHAVKKMTTNTMHMYGDGMHKLEGITMDNVTELLDEFRATQGKPFNPKENLTHATLCILMTLMMGCKLPKDDKVLQKILFGVIDKDPELFSITGPGAYLDWYPWLRHFNVKIYDALKAYKKQFLEQCLGGLIQDQRETLDPDNLRGVFDTLMYAYCGMNGNGGNHMLDDQDLRCILADLLAAGTLTTTSTMCVFMAICAVDPEIQAKMRQNIEDHIGSRTPTLNDRHKMHYVEAVMLELHRYASIVPMSVPHKALVDTSISGYRIPKGTEVWTNLWYLHHNEKEWDDPWKFKPERFLDENGETVHPAHPVRRKLIPFGAGLRVCLGKNMATNRIFLFLTMILQRFKIEPADELPNIDCRDFESGIILFPKPFKIRIVPLQ